MSTEEETVTFIYHHAELSLKGKNRSSFENVLTENIKHLFGQSGVKCIKIHKLTGRHFVTFAKADEAKAYEISPKIFGIANFGKCISVQREIDPLKEKIIANVKDILAKRKIESFKIETSRVDKDTP